MRFTALIMAGEPKFSLRHCPDKSSLAISLFCRIPLAARGFSFPFLRAPAGCSALNLRPPKLAKPTGKREIRDPHFIYTQGIYVYKHFISFGKSGFTRDSARREFLRRTSRTEINVSHTLVLASAVESLLIYLLFGFPAKEIYYFISFLFPLDFDFFFIIEDKINRFHFDINHMLLLDEINATLFFLWSLRKFCVFFYKVFICFYTFLYGYCN